MLLPVLLAALGFPTLKTFGTGKSAFQLTSEEVEILAYNVSDVRSTGVLTHFWMTGGPAKGGGTDNATVRYYIDGESSPSIEFKPPLAAGVGFDDDFVWGHAKAGHGSDLGGWYVNYKIPFGSSVRVTVALPSGSAMAYVIVRGCENMPVHIGSLTLPSSARLRLHKIESVTFQPLEWVNIVDIPSGQGLVYLTAITANSSTSNFWEGCYHLYTPHDQPFPGTVLSTGMEDFFDSAYGFHAGPYHFPVSGCTHREHWGERGMAVSAYRFHEEDPIAFTGGAKFVWRIGDLTNEATHPESPKCYIDQKGPGDKVVGSPQPTTVTSYAWVYTW
jgi:hypothetical protein